METRDREPPVRPAAARGAHGAPRSEEFSPELALVDPVAAAAARAELPARPWDVPRDNALRRPAQPLAPRDEPSVASAIPADPRRLERARRRAPRRGLSAVHRLAWMSVWAVLVTGLALVAEVSSPNAPALGARVQPVLPTPVPRAGYRIGPRSGFRTGAEARALGSFTLPVPCARGVELPRLIVHADKSFSFNGTVTGRRRAFRVWLQGRFVAHDTAVGSVTVRAAGCPRQPVAFVAQLTRR